MVPLKQYRSIAQNELRVRDAGTQLEINGIS